MTRALYPGRDTVRSIAVAFVAAAIVLISFPLGAQEAGAVLGGDFEAVSGENDVVVTCLGKNASYSHRLYLDNTGKLICDSGEKGKKTNLGTFPAGMVLVFRLEARPETPVPPAGGSCEPRSRREEEVDAWSSSTTSNDEIGHNPLQSKGLRRHGRIFVVAAPRRWHGIDVVAAPRICAHGARNGQYRGFSAGPLDVMQSGQSYFTGPASRNPDGVIHAKMTDAGKSGWHFGFEDLEGGGDSDFDDCLFLVSGVIAMPAPEPAASEKNLE